VTFEAYSEARVKLINAYIEQSLLRYRNQISQRFGPLVEAMKYSLESGGKRLRPLLLFASAEYLGLNPEDVLPAACAIEYIHTYSLVHDDLPALDDDDMRRGKPSSHKKFGEPIAILTGDALLTEAFGEMSMLAQNKKFTGDQIMRCIELLVQHAGIRGMVGGQLLDVTTDPAYSLPEIEFIHIHKTGAMILASVLLPTRLTTTSPETFQKLRRYGEAVGLAFQISDDILDSEAMLRYSRGPRKKPTPSYSQIMGPSEMKEKLHGLIDSGVNSLGGGGERAQALVEIAEFIRTRKH
jgi:geranylgeranyl diphosphate synthase, type II